MYKQRLKKPKKIEIVIAAFFLLLVNCVFQKSFRQIAIQPIEIEADTAEMDDVSKITIYRGNVIVTQGSIKMTGHTMTVHFDKNNDMELVIMNGTPATYRQLPDDGKVFDEAEALQMEYYALKNYVILIDRALVTQEGLKFSGKRIEYDTILSKVKAEGRPNTADKKEENGNKQIKVRVKIIIKKKTQE